MAKNKFTTEHQEMLFQLFLKYGEISIRNLTLEIEEETQQSNRNKKSKIQMLYDLIEYLVSKISITEGVVIRVKHDNKVLIIGDQSVITGKYTREDVINDSHGNHYVLLDGHGNVFSDAVMRKDFTILPEDDESEVHIDDEDEIEFELRDKIDHMLTHFNHKDVFGVQAHAYFVHHPMDKTKTLQIRICIIPEEAAIDPNRCHILTHEHVREVFKEDNINNKINSKLNHGFSFGTKGEA